MPGAAEYRARIQCSVLIWTRQPDVLIVESENDQVIPHTVIANYVAACSQATSVTSRVITGAQHGLSEQQWQRACAATLTKWLAEMMGSNDQAQPFLITGSLSNKVTTALA